MGEGWQSVSQVDLWLMVAKTQWGSVWCWHLAAAVLTVVLLSNQVRHGGYLLIVALLSQLLTLSLVGHVAMSVGIIGALHRINQFGHLLTAAFWSGGLLALLNVMQEAKKASWGEQATATMIRFSLYGHLAVATVILSGIINILLIQGWEFPSDTQYIRLLAIKIVLVGVMVILALFNRYFWLPRMKNRSSLAKRFFWYFTVAEQLIALLVLLLVSQFATLQP
ncbi:MAG: Inner membrane protein YebZ [Candidatus Erwinia impunctatus]|nr:Inner membrane protein YebZ [Culicoides impunctatus]